MKITLIICILLFNLQNCEQRKSNEDKMKSNYKDKPLLLLRDYLYVRMFDRYLLGDPLCGGDSIGSSLGLNSDIPKPIPIEIGKSYQFQGNPNLVNSKNATQRNSNLFITSNNFNKNLSVTLTLSADCSSSISFGLYFCSGTNYLQANYTCSKSPELVAFNLSPNINGQYLSCTFKQNSQSFFITISSNDCLYNLLTKEI